MALTDPLPYGQSCCDELPILSLEEPLELPISLPEEPLADLDDEYVAYFLEKTSTLMPELTSSRVDTGSALSGDTADVIGRDFVNPKLDEPCQYLNDSWQPSA